MTEFKYKMVIAVRKDIKLSQGKIAAQVAHAAVNCAFAAKKSTPMWFRRWYDEGQKKVVVKVQGKEDIFRLKMDAETLGLMTSVITDAGLTEVPPGTMTCLGIGPGPEEKVDRVTGELGLM